MVAGEFFSFDFQVRKLHGADWIVLTVQPDGSQVIGCRWHLDAQPREVAVALRALADELDPPAKARPVVDLPITTQSP